MGPRACLLCVRSVDESEPESEAKIVAITDDQADFLVVLALLRKALGDARGKMLVSDAQRLGLDDLQRASHYRKGLIARALRYLGWARCRSRFDGTLKYAYARGTRLQRENILDVVLDAEGHLVVKQREP